MSKMSNNTQTLISEGTKIVGEVNVQSDLRIDGYIKGTIKVGGTLVITAPGKVEGEVQTSGAIIAGTLQGNLHAGDKVVLEANSHLIGDLKTKNLVISEGAVFHGNCQMGTAPSPEANKAKQPQVQQKEKVVQL